MRHIIFIAAAILIFNSCSKQSSDRIPQSSDSKSSTSENYKRNASLVVDVNPGTGGAAPDFSWYDSAGNQISLKDVRGKNVLINFWATWCGPCKAELPDIEAISKQFADKGLVIIGVSEDRGGSALSDVSDFAAANGLTYQIVIDNDNVANAYGNIDAIPTSFIVDKDGKIVAKWIGSRDKAFFESTVKKYVD
ncbi:MAG: TlpA family protein disulfide reductase [Candidatus Kryptoniota bacterium]